MTFSVRPQDESEFGPRSKIEMTGNEMMGG